MNLEQFRLDGKAALITGGSRGLGLAMARALAGAGAEVAVCSRHAEELAEAGRELEAASGRATLTVAADVTQAEDRERLVSAALERFGRLDVLVNNAGTGLRRPVLEMSEDDWRRILEVNLTAPFLLAQRAAREMLARRWGRILNISSALGSIALPDRSAYCASKGGLLQLTRVMALEWAEAGITVNAICPGPFKTPYNLRLQENPSLYESYLRLIPQHRWGDLDEIGGAAVFLASDAASFITGTALYVDGGWTAHGGIPDPGASD